MYETLRYDTTDGSRRMEETIAKLPGSIELDPGVSTGKVVFRVIQIAAVICLNTAAVILNELPQTTRYCCRFLQGEQLHSTMVKRSGDTLNKYTMLPR